MPNDQLPAGCLGSKDGARNHTAGTLKEFMSFSRIAGLGTPLVFLAICIGCNTWFCGVNPRTTLLTLVDAAVASDDAVTVHECLTNGWDTSSCLMPNTGITALHVAAALGSTNVIKVLLSHGANRSTWDNLGEIPLKYAIEYGHTNAAQMLGRAEVMQSRESATIEIIECVLMRVCGDSLRAAPSVRERLVIAILVDGKSLSDQVSSEIARRFDVTLTDGNKDVSDSRTHISLRVTLEWKDMREVTAYVSDGGESPSYRFSAKIVRLFGYWIVIEEVGGES